MTESAVGFVRALLEDPEDSTTREIFADWLEDRADGRTNLVRAGARLVEGVPDLDERERLWADIHAEVARWQASLSPRGKRLGRLRWKRGLFRLDSTVARLAGFGAATLRGLFAEVGIETVRLEPDPVGVISLLGRQKLAACPSLDLNGQVFAPEQWTEFTGERLNSVARLDLSNTGLRDADLPGLVRRGVFTRLVRLDLRNNRLNGPEVLALLDPTVAPDLRYLGLHGNPLRDDVFEQWYRWRGRKDAHTTWQGIPTRRLTRFGLEMRLIRPGSYRRGTSSAGGHSSERPAKLVRITRPFYLAAFPTTQAQVMRTIGVSRSHFRTADTLDPTGESPSLPAEEAGRDLAARVCERLQAETDEQRAGLIFRLPTEAEWEYAARAHEPSDYEYAGSRSLRGADPFNHDGPASQRRTCPVGSYPPNAWELYDIHGNVWDWVADFFGSGYYSESPEEDPPGPATGTHGLLRGGSWFNRPMICRITYRCPTTLPSGSFCIGFRIAASITTV